MVRPGSLSRWLVAPAAGIAWLATPVAARADDRAAAQLLFEQGKQLVAQGKMAEACPKFEAAAHLSQTPGVRLNLVDCWASVGRIASARAMADEALGLAERAGDAPAAAAARERRAALQKRLTYLRVALASGAAVEGLAVFRDGQEMPAAELETQVPVDLGSHEIRAQAPGRQPWSTTQTLSQEATTVTVTVPVLPSSEEPKPAPPAPEAEAASGARGMSTTRKLALVSAGLGIVGLGIGTYFGVNAISQKNTYQAHEGSGGQCADATCQSASHDAYASGVWSTVAVVAGGALCATGAALWFFFPGSSTSVAPMASPQTAGLLVRGGW